MQADEPKWQVTLDGAPIAGYISAIAPSTDSTSSECNRHSDKHLFTFAMRFRHFYCRCDHGLLCGFSLNVEEPGF